MYVGVCMSVCSYICLRAYAYVKPFFLRNSYGTAHSKFAVPILHCFYSYKLNYTFTLAAAKGLIGLHMPAQSAQCSRQQLQFAPPQKPRPDCTT